jgi:Na+-driven multidrug efflux pump
MALVLPMIIQNAVTNFVNMLDNFMVGSLGDEAVSGVAIDNQFIFVFNLAIFGAV